MNECKCNDAELARYGMSALCDACAAEWAAWLMSDPRAVAVITDTEVANAAA